ncbi:SIP domain-containing protein [uncultured Winogradskyella sp.]|uniref:siderophore-interacting protein n=1 Tax=uncultured Winogradskyella sp. TaxID=395353 RepID=UPI0030EF5FAD|tara:strand:- start:1098 stop:1823 length:726 start_codon:yes stop_codon:yes gene_type:complete
MGIAETIMKKVLDKGIITQKTKLSDSAYKIRIKSDSINTVNFIAGHFLRLGVGIGKNDIPMKDKVRSYSVWDIDRNHKTMDLAIATHGNGIGTKWVENCKPQDTIHFKWKKGKFTIDQSADSYLMIGDLSALSHLYIINRNLPKEKHVEGIIYSQNINELFTDVDGTKPFQFYQMQQNPHNEIIDKLQGLINKMQGRKMVYIAGDSRTCIALNNYFRKNLNWKTEQIKTKPFWNPNKKGLE